MIYTFISSGTDNGKQFHTPEEALAQKQNLLFVLKRIRN